MRVSGMVRNGEALTHLFRNHPRTFYPRFVHSLSTNPPTVKMTSVGSEWTALRVRETFLDYFKQNGHTFGRSRPRFFFRIPLHPAT
jgi:alanyl-tRNA synthetase